GSRRPPREAEEVGARVERAVTVPAGENTLVLCQRSEAGMVRLLVRQERQYFRLSGSGRRTFLSRSRRTSRRDGRLAAAGGDTRCRAARAAPQDAVRCDGTGCEVLRRHAGLAQWRQ